MEEGALRVMAVEVKANAVRNGIYIFNSLS